MCAPRGVRVLRGARKGAEAVCRLHSYPGGVCLDLLVPLRRSPCSLQEAGVRDGCPPGAPFPPPLPAPCVIGVSPRVCVSPKSRSSPPSPLLPRTVLGIVRAPPKILQHFFFPCNAVLCVASNPHRNHTAFFSLFYFFFPPQRSASFWASPEVSHKIRQLFVPQFCTGRFQRVPIPNNPTPLLPPPPPPQTKKSHMSFIQ